MDVMPWTALFFQSIPEEIILVTLGLALIGEYPGMKGIVAVGISGAVFSFYFRHLSLPFGIHTLASIVVLALAMWLLLRVNLFKGLLAAFLGIVSLGIIESISFPLISLLTGLSFEAALQDPLLRILFPLPDEIILGLFAYFCRRRRLSLISTGKLISNNARKDNEDEK
ncbi:MAG: hypothetical protein PWR22_271 [Moorella sp. (in: firmicutes)]|jgi:hypothetical protein|uniref:hypothetical protein n=1 Tax=unclassified Neomoorella TaxID=2676739 RepID=UPI0010FFC05D|nr:MULTISPECIES: hypothetical protein [unclassified Moorella (in: firmicutes)]MDK2815643.1 hypothetical protein [Moorella sp. (in: firmicutes)]MDK2894171.1 hypothetical protein [Moorella sp. (in: firmicutes)]GEA15084.1 hypothetical protein E308F_13280 [Moorella sp. E308F]GEA17005.1 hypothetical protein E306M_01390 [Moorella sp. E306M]